MNGGAFDLHRRYERGAISPPMRSRHDRLDCLVSLDDHSAIVRQGRNPRVALSYGNVTVFRVGAARRQHQRCRFAGDRYAAEGCLFMWESTAEPIQSRTDATSGSTKSAAVSPDGLTRTDIPPISL